MAKTACTEKELIAIEDDLRDIAAKIKEIRRLLVDSNEPSVQLDIGTTLFYVAWLKGWSGKSVGAAPGTIAAQKKARLPAKPKRKS